MTRAKYTQLNGQQDMRATIPEKGEWALGGLFAPIAVTLLAFSGFLKISGAVTGIPFDLTLIAAALVVVGIVARLLRDRGATPIPWLLVALIVAYVVPGLFVGREYEFTSETRLGVILSILSGIGGAYLVTTRKGVIVWLAGCAASGLALALSFSVGSSALSAVPYNSIAIGQGSGVACVILVVLIMRRGLSRRLWVPAGIACALLALVVFEAGSRGAVLASAIAIAAAALPGARHRVIRVLLAAAAVGAGYWFLSRSNSAGAQRLQAALSGRIDNTQSRDGLWQAALGAIPSHPTGIGWGSFSSVLQPSSSGVRHYPHNWLMQAGLEGGWLAGVVTVAFIAVGFWRLWHASGDPLMSSTFAVAVFFTVAAMFSGSVGDNRMAFAALAIGIAGNPAIRSAKNHTEPIRPPSGSLGATNGLRADGGRKRHSHMRLAVEHSPTGDLQIGSPPNHAKTRPSGPGY